MDAPYIAQQTKAVIYGSSSALNVARGVGVPEEKLVQFQANETYEVGGYRIKVIPSIHSKPTIINNDLGQTIDDGYQADVLFLGVAGLQKADAKTEQKFYEETIEKLNPKIVIPVHWDNFFSPLTKPVVGMPRLVEKTEVVFFKLANYCEAHGVNCVVQIPGTSMEI